MPEFAPRDETAKREEQLEELIAGVLGLPWAFISDGSTLADFEGVRTPAELSELCVAVYGVALGSHHFDLPLWQLLDELNANRPN
jgi:hypothetical protein